MKRSNIVVLFIAIFAVAIIAVMIVLTRVRGEPTTDLTSVGERVWPVHKVIGISVEGRSIDAYTYGNGPNHILFVGGIHGGYELNSVLLANEFKDYLEADMSSVTGKLTVTIVPELNPDAVASTSTMDVERRTNANGVDLNRNFDCNWQAEAVWRGTKIGAGPAAFSEPETQAVRNLVAKIRPVAVIFWHSQAGAVYGSKCEGEILPESRDIMNLYSLASGYDAVETFDAYPVTGASEDWLASIGIPAITVELTNHRDIEWDKNLAGIMALLEYYSER